jgi:uncharacterized membrane protein
MHDELPDRSTLSVRERWLAAVAYLGPGCLVTMFTRHRTPYLKWHAQQGFALFFLEAAVVALLIILDNTIGRIPILGLVVIILTQLAAFVIFLVLSILGFVKALAGESFRIPVLDDYAEKVPLHDS